MDNVLIFGSNKIKHDRQVCEMLNRLKTMSVTLNEKCKFSVTSIQYFGYVISANGISADPEKISAIQNLPPASDVTGVQ